MTRGTISDKLNKTMTTMRRSDELFEINLVTRRQNAVGEILFCLLTGLGIKPEKIAETVRGDRDILSVYATRRQAGRLKAKIGTLKLKHVRLNVRRLKKTAWRDRWLKDLKPFALTKRFEMVPLGYKKEYRPRKLPIYLEIGAAFGSGLHETTRFMAQFIEECAGGFETFLDVGTGTGVLSIIAGRSGAKDIDALDISRESVEIARRNLKINQVAQAKVARRDFKKFTKKKKYDLLAANLFTRDLIELKRKLCARVKPGAYLAVSGIALEHLRMLRAAYRVLPLRCLRVRKGRKWVAVLYKKAD